MNSAFDLGLDLQAQIIGVMTAMGESSLRVLDYGDAVGPDSRGLFQQRDSWGTLEQRLNPTESANLFYARLITVSDWQSLSPTIAAHRVQGNADPLHYDNYLESARTVVAALGSTRANCAPVSNPSDDYPWQLETTESDGGQLSPLGYYYRECVDFIAWRINRDAGTTASPWAYTWSTLTPLGGDAIKWKLNWVERGWTVSSTPVPGSIAWWGADAGPAGHVAYVQSVSPAGEVSLEEYNWGNDHVYDQRTIPASEADAFLYPPPRA
ncbi:CHAP domain-containing protein [Naasia lichenicola]|uniref:CHAP domain-containing protein n=1 Tax=Naasia lichenicola TaxID=2565933 RepID=A0A4S4FGF0_9MICO|nr:CHAP domain-containing protein [Naasia lichenicola]THG29293.1 CHAP domain-containing protein [Naasia lichenicola]